MRPLDLVLFGATGFTGRLVAAALVRMVAPGEIAWALAGRDRAKLERLRAELAADAPGWSKLEILTATSDDERSLRAMVERTQVVATTVGPYVRHGEPLVGCCVEAGTDYVDLTGEPTFWRGVIDHHHQQAIERGALIVPCCGFDSIPHDLGAWLTARQLAPARDIHVRGYVSARGSFSGGTWASALGILADARASELLPLGDRPRIHRAEEIGKWAIPLPTIDPLVVERSARFCPDFGPGFRYEHYFTVRSLPRLASVLASVGTAFALAQSSVIRRALERVRASGEGPSEQQRARGRFRVVFLGRAGDRSVRVEVTGHDPGYGHTAEMLAAAALTLVRDRDRLPRPLAPSRGGVLTPASALGDPLLRRLEATGMSFRVVDPTT
jgi:saccharopine dehydrogenase (NAD+, L-glutamate forming)